MDLSYELKNISNFHHRHILFSLHNYLIDKETVKPKPLDKTQIEYDLLNSMELDWRSFVSASLAISC